MSTPFLVDDRAGVGAFHHAVEGHADARFAVEHRPVDRGATAVFRQQRAVHVEGAERGEREDLRADHVAVVNREDQIGLQRGDFLAATPAC